MFCLNWDFARTICMFWCHTLVTVLQSFLIAFSAIIFATFTTGLDSASFSFSKDEGNVTDDKVPYSYGFFHFVFAMGSMYFAMLFVGWNLHQTMHRWSIDVGWSSTWVKIVNEWLAAGLYIWTMIGPFIFKGRDFTWDTSPQLVSPFKPQTSHRDFC